jgi:dephospho-CoA kinase
MTNRASTSSPRPIPVIGVVGGIGSGKSAVARHVATLANVLVIDADRLGHEALLDTDVKHALRQQFGEGIFDAADEVNRRSLARSVFGEEASHRSARHTLEQIVHPRIEQKISQQISDATASGREAVLLDAAVLLEAGWRHLCDAVVFVDTDEDLRLERVQQRSGWSFEELRRREASQLSLPEKRSQADVVISNNGSVDVAGRQFLNFLRGR